MNLIDKINTFYYLKENKEPENHFKKHWKKYAVGATAAGAGAAGLKKFDDASDRFVNNIDGHHSIKYLHFIRNHTKTREGREKIDSQIKDIINNSDHKKELSKLNDAYWAKFNISGVEKWKQKLKGHDIDKEADETYNDYGHKYGKTLDDLDSLSDKAKVYYSNAKTIAKHILNMD